MNKYAIVNMLSFFKLNLSSLSVSTKLIQIFIEILRIQL